MNHAAIIFATTKVEPFEAVDFLQDYLKWRVSGEAREMKAWPEWTDFLSAHMVEGRGAGETAHAA